MKMEADRSKGSFTAKNKNASPCEPEVRRIKLPRDTSIGHSPVFPFRLFSIKTPRLWPFTIDSFAR